NVLEEGPVRAYNLGIVAELSEAELRLESIVLSSLVRPALETLVNSPADGVLDIFWHALLPGKITTSLDEPVADQQAQLMLQGIHARLHHLLVASRPECRILSK